MKQKVLSFLDTFKIYDMEDNLLYEINAKFNPIQATYIITVYNNKVVSPDDAIYLMAILNSIKSSKSSSSSKSKK